MRGGSVLRDLDHRSLGPDVAAQNDEPALSTQRVGERRDDLLSRGLLDRLAFLAQRPAGDGECIAVDVTAFDQALGQKRDAARAVELDTGEPATRLAVAQQ